MAPRTVRYEDVLNVTAQPAQIHESKPPAGQESETHMGGSTFLSTWMPVEDMPDDIESVVDVVEEAKDKPKAKAEKSIHHFCTFTDDMQLPDHYRGVWRRYHVPSKHDITPSQKSEVSNINWKNLPDYNGRLYRYDGYAEINMTFWKFITRSPLDKDPEAAMGNRQLYSYTIFHLFFLFFHLIY